MVAGDPGGQGEHRAPEALDPVRDSVNLWIRTAAYRYIFRWHDEDELYDLATDPGEKRNARADPGAATLITALRHDLATSLGTNLSDGTRAPVGNKLRGGECP